MFEYFDIHSHLYFPDYDGDREEEIGKIKEAKIGTIAIGTDLDSSLKSIALADSHSNIFASVGQHPGDLNNDSVFDERLLPLAENKKVVAVGECGLDYFRMSPDDSGLKVIQKTVFEYHIDFALSSDLPLMLHVRSSSGTQDAYNDALNILEHHAKISGDKLRGNAHFFAGDMEVLKRLLNIGFSVSFTGVLTFTRDYDELVKYVPLNMIMSETDAPFVSPIPHRGKRNSPLLVPLVVEKIAEVKGQSLDTVKETILANVSRSYPAVAQHPLL